MTKPLCGLNVRYVTVYDATSPILYIQQYGINHQNCHYGRKPHDTLSSQNKPLNVVGKSVNKAVDLIQVVNFLGE